MKQIEEFYKKHYKNDNIDLSKLKFPSGVLLGCVSVKDCQPQEQYRMNYPNGESESPFVLICEDPQELSIKIPIKGQHKICEYYLITLKHNELIIINISDKMDQNIHNAAAKSLNKLIKSQ